LREVGVWGYLRATAGAATSIMLAILFATSSARAASPGAVRRPAPVAAVVAERPAGSPLPPFAFGAVGALGVGVIAGERWSKRRSRERS
jgi:hypothetical protein